jgi:hypothetical protein
MYEKLFRIIFVLMRDLHMNNEYPKNIENILGYSKDIIEKRAI